MRTIKRILGVFLFALTLVLVTPSILPVNGNVYTVEAATKINKKKVTLIKGQTTALKITGTKKKVKWSSNKKSVATVSSKGKVTAKKKGKATITAKVGKKKLTCKVIVQTPKLSETKLNMKVGDSKTLKLFGTDQKVIWKSSDKSIANVSNSGEITAKKSGTVKITATVLKKKYTCTVAVAKPNPQDEILAKIDKKFVLDSFYSSDWNNSLIGIFKNNTGYDLEFTVTVSCYNEDGELDGEHTEIHPYFSNNSEIVMVFDRYDIGSYDVEYKIKKAPEASKYIYNNSGLYETLDEFNRIEVASNTAYGFYGDGVIVYFDSHGNVIDYNIITVDVDNDWDRDVVFDLPVDRNLNNVMYSKYITSYYSYDY